MRITILTLQTPSVGKSYDLASGRNRSSPIYRCQIRMAEVRLDGKIRSAVRPGASKAGPKRQIRPIENFVGMRKSFDGAPFSFDRVPMNFDGTRMSFDGVRKSFVGGRMNFDGMRMGFAGVPMSFVGTPIGFVETRMSFVGAPISSRGTPVDFVESLLRALRTCSPAMPPLSWPSPPVGEKVPAGRLREIRAAACSRCAVRESWRLPKPGSGQAFEACEQVGAKVIPFLDGLGFSSGNGAPSAKQAKRRGRALSVRRFSWSHLNQNPGDSISRFSICGAYFFTDASISPALPIKAKTRFSRGKYCRMIRRASAVEKASMR